MIAVKISEIKKEIKNLIKKASFNLPPDIVTAIKNSLREETSLRAKEVLSFILKNEKIARKEKLPLCQDCGTVYVSFYIGPNFCIEDDIKNKMAKTSSNKENKKTNLSFGINHYIDKAVAEAYNENYLRKSVVSDPLFERKNTSGNIPAVIDIFFSENSSFDIEVGLKGGGSENCSYLFMLNPSSSCKDVIKIVLDVVKKNVTECCPPVIIGVGIGGTASEVTKLARKATFRNIDLRNSDTRYKKLEDAILKEVNKTGIGPQGLGGRTTALACNIEFAPCHMATLPVSIFLGCHSTRRASSKISPP